MGAAADALNTAAAGPCKTGDEMGRVTANQHRDELCSVLAPMRCNMDGWCSLSERSPNSCVLPEDIMSTCIHSSFVETFNSDTINITAAGTQLFNDILRCNGFDGS